MAASRITAAVAVGPDPQLGDDGKLRGWRSSPRVSTGIALSHIIHTLTQVRKTECRIDSASHSSVC